MSTDTGHLPRLESRESYVDHLEGFTTTDIGQHEPGKPKRTRIKTYMLETARYDHSLPAFDRLFPDDAHLHRLDDTLYRVEDAANGRRIVGLIENLDDRHPVLYTTLPVNESEKWVRRVVDHNPWLDRLWLSSPILFELWRYVQRTTPIHRYVRLGFEHTARYETPSDLLGVDQDPYDDADTSDEDERAPLDWIERRRSRVSLTERLALLNTKLMPLMELYDPLHSLVQLQIPAGERGGHRLYYDGRATNWSDSFLEHRTIVDLVVRLYRKVTTHAEDRLWVDTTQVGEDGLSFSGAPVTIRFSEQLSEPTFQRFVDLALRRRTSRFRIGGYIKERGPTKVHLTGIDRHLWQPFLLEATSHHLLVVLPRGTCGNTIHRLVTNVQRYVDPKVDVWLGSERYSHAVANSMTTT
ncbi:MAG: hypothetical protein OXS29_16070 [bacterium]|nr:hypothetical protein [bacterium]MDE0290789.1 hypothetical protein [bacterium]MDE0438168.1 hypothetical protein [bacterium]